MRGLWCACVCACVIRTYLLLLTSLPSSTFCPFLILTKDYHLSVSTGYEPVHAYNHETHIYLAMAIYDMSSHNWSIRCECALRDCVYTHSSTHFIFWLKSKSQSWSLFKLLLEFSLCFPSSSLCRSPWFNLWKCFPHWRRNDRRSPTLMMTAVDSPTYPSSTEKDFIYSKPSFLHGCEWKV